MRANQKGQTEKSKYKSRYSDSFITPAQYIVELLCENIAKKHGKELPARFWQLDEWGKFFKSQIRESNRLLRQYTPKAIITTLQSRDGSKITSLRAGWLNKLIEQNVSKKEENKEIPETCDVLEMPKSVKKNNTLNKLKNLEG